MFTAIVPPEFLTVNLRLIPLLLLALGVGAMPALAHHSGAMFYNREGDLLKITGEVQRFNFANPHAIVELLVTADSGELQRWTAETASPSGLKRRGWSQDSLPPGAIVTLEGYPALDGSRLMRITRVWLEDGTEVGVPPGISN
jgi:hypothetical protein